MKDAVLIELAATWELQAATGGDGLNRLQPAARETLRACADMLRMLVDSAVFSPPAAAPVVPADAEAELLKGWKLNHVQFVRGSGKAEIGYLDAEDDRFSPIVTVDTGLYYQPDDAAPLARAILALLAATPACAAPVPVLTDEQIDAAWNEATGGHIVTEDMRAFARAILATKAAP